jgi:hypothetical protein
LKPRGPPASGHGHALFASEVNLIAFGNNPIAWEAIPNDAPNFIGRISALLSPLVAGLFLALADDR